MPRLARALSAALVLACAAAGAARAQQANLARELQRFRATPAAEWSEDNGAWLYRELLLCRAAAPARWPAGEELEALADELFAAARAAGHDADRYARTDYDATLAFEQAGRVAAARAHLERALARYEPGAAHLPHLALTLASYARLCRELDAAGAWLARAAELLAAAPEGAARREARALLALERTSHWIAIGLEERGPAELAEARAAIDALAADAPAVADALRADLALEELNLWNALDDPDAALAALDAARAAPWWAARDPARARMLRLREAAALAERARVAGDEPIEALELLVALLDDPALAPDEAALARLVFADLELEAGALDSAAFLLDEARAGLAPAANPCAHDLPTRREIDLFALSARLAARRGGDAAELAAARAEAERALAALLARWADAPLHDGGLSLLATRDRLRVAEARIELDLAALGPEAGARAALETAARLQAAGSLARALGAPPLDADEARARLAPAGGGLLVYVPGERRSWALVADAAGFAAFPLPPVADWDAARRAAQVELSLAARRDRRTPALDAALEALETALLPPALRARVAGWSSFALAGLEGTGDVPFELFRAGAAEPLGRRAALTFLPSLPVGALLAARAPRPGDGARRRALAVVAAGDAPAFAPGHEQLEAIAFDGAARAALCGGLRGVAVALASGRAADPAALRAAGASDALALQVVAHTVASGRAARPKSLLLAPGADGAAVIDPGALEALCAPPLVALIACGAASGPLRRGDDGRHHLVGALFVAGAAAQLAARVELDFDGALALAGTFHRALLVEGASPAEALLAARRAADPDALTPLLVRLWGAGHAPWVAPLAPRRSPAPLVALALAGAALVGVARLLPARPRGA